MRNKGIYFTLWKKYLPAIKILIKKAITEEQTLKLYKHELNIPGVAVDSFVFNLKIKDGKPVYKTDTKVISSDLMDILIENESLLAWMKNKSLSISLDAACMLKISGTDNAVAEVN